MTKKPADARAKLRRQYGKATADKVLKKLDRAMASGGKTQSIDRQVCEDLAELCVSAAAVLTKSAGG